VGLKGNLPSEWEAGWRTRKNQTGNQARIACPQRPLADTEDLPGVVIRIPPAVLVLTDQDQ
jgi:hypothetical protein